MIRAGIFTISCLFYFVQFGACCFGDTEKPRPGEPKIQCPQDWHKAGTHCYQLILQPAKSASEAKDACSKLSPPGGELPSFFELEDWHDILRFLIYKAVSFNYNEIKFWLGASLKPPGEPEQQWIWSNQVPVTWVNWISPPPEIRYEPVDKTAESCGLGWAQKSSQKNGWLKTKCNSNGDVATICQFKPGLKDKKSPHDNAGLTVTHVRKAFESIQLENGHKIEIDISKKELESANSLLNELNKLVAKKMGLPTDFKRSFSPIRGDNYVSPEDLQDEIDKIKASMGEKPSSPQKHKRSINNGIERWTTRRPITYQYALNLGRGTARIKPIFERAIQFWQSHTCYNFTVDDEADFVIIDGGGCYSVVGKAKFKRPQPISMGQGCDSFATATHELGHLLGLDHEQTRPDRDQYVEVFLNNVNLSNIDNFRTCCDCGSKKFRPYDFGSIMHYASTEFSLNNKSTVLPKEPDYWRTIGNSHEPSFLDVKTVNENNCASYCQRSKTKCQNGGYPHPRNCKTCLCPPGFGGPTCNTYAALEKSKCGHSHDVTDEFHTFSSPNYPGLVKNESCVWLFKANDDKKIELEFDSLFDMPDICKFGYIEVRADTDLRPTGKRFCGSKPPGKIVSNGNIMIVIMRKFSSIDRHHGFSAKVRSVSTKIKRAGKKESTDVSVNSANEKCVFVGGAVRNAGPAGLSLRADNE